MQVKTVSDAEQEEFIKTLEELMSMLKKKKLIKYSKVIYTLIEDNQNLYKKLEEYKHDYKTGSRSEEE